MKKFSVIIPFSIQESGAEISQIEGFTPSNFVGLVIKANDREEALKLFQEAVNRAFGLESKP